jgi:hypothetical protein
VVIQFGWRLFKKWKKKRKKVKKEKRVVRTELDICVFITKTEIQHNTSRKHCDTE